MPSRRARSSFPASARRARRRQLTQGVPTAGRVPERRHHRARGRRRASPTSRTWSCSCATPISRPPSGSPTPSTPIPRQRFGKRVAARAGFAHRRHQEAGQRSRPRASIAEIENLVVEADTPARVVIDERTGTIVIGNDVRISRVAISHGTLTVRITEAPQRRPARAFLRRRDGGRALHRHRGHAARRAASPCSTGPISKRWSPASTASASSRTASSPSCRASSRPARCRPTWFSNRPADDRSSPLHNSTARARRCRSAPCAAALAGGLGAHRDDRRQAPAAAANRRRHAQQPTKPTAGAGRHRDRALLLQHRRRRPRPPLCAPGEELQEAAGRRSTSASRRSRTSAPNTRTG